MRKLSRGEESVLLAMLKLIELFGNKKDQVAGGYIVEIFTIDYESWFQNSNALFLRTISIDFTKY